MPKEETFSIPFKYIDVTRSTHINLDVKQEKKIDDYWKKDSIKHFWNSWRGFTKFTLLKEKPPKGYLLSWERLTKIQTTTRTDHVRPEVWTKIGKAAQNRQKQEWAKEKPKLDNGRKLRGIYIIFWITKRIQKLSKTQIENWKYRWLPRCRGKDIQASSECKAEDWQRKGVQHTSFFAECPIIVRVANN